MKDKKVIIKWVDSRQIHGWTFDNEKDAFNAYKQAREEYIKEVAQKYYDEGKITERVYDALLRYEIDIND